MKKMITELEYIRKAYKFALEKIEKLEKEVEIHKDAVKDLQSDLKTYKKENIRISNQRDNLS